MTDSTAGRRLTRAQDGRPAARVRSVHLGLGNFFRAHQAYYTEHAADASHWGIAAFTGMAIGPAQDIADQEGLYTLLVRGAAGDQPEVISSLSEVHGSTELGPWRACFADPELAFVSTTVTEAGYRRNSEGGLDFADPEVAADLALLQGDGVDADVSTAPGKLVLGLMVRRANGGGGFTILPCDNVPDNGPMAERVVHDLAAAVDADLDAWISANVSFVTTMVDRITPRAVAQDQADLLAATGVDDPALVVTEPYLEWVLSGDFRAGRPAWEGVGARFVDDILPWEHRKLWLLNGSHSLMAYAATVKGHETVASAIIDPQVRTWVEDWWDVAARHLPLSAGEITDYRAALIERFENPNIKHLLAQIAADGSQKIKIRIIPALLADRAEGRMPTGATRAVAAWIAHLRGHGAPVNDALAAEVVPLATAGLPEAVENVLRWLGVNDAEVAQLVRTQVDELTSGD